MTLVAATVLRTMELVFTGAAGLLLLVFMLLAVGWTGVQIGNLLEPLVCSPLARRNAWKATKALGVVAFWCCVVIGLLMLIGMLFELCLGGPVAQVIPELAQRT